MPVFLWKGKTVAGVLHKEKGILLHFQALSMGYNSVSYLSELSYHKNWVLFPVTKHSLEEVKKGKGVTWDEVGETACCQNS